MADGARLADVVNDMCTSIVEASWPIGRTEKGWRSAALCWVRLRRLEPPLSTKTVTPKRTSDDALHVRSVAWFWFGSGSFPWHCRLVRYGRTPHESSVATWHRPQQPSLRAEGECVQWRFPAPNSSSQSR